MYLINVDYENSKGTHWVSLFIDISLAVYFEHIYRTYISHDKFVTVNNVLRKYYEMNEELKNPETSMRYIL